MARISFHGLRLIALITVAALGAAVVLSGDAPAQASGRYIERIPFGGDYAGIAISADGRVVAVGGGVFDRKTGESDVISGVGYYGQVSLSGDGRYVGFVTEASLVPEDVVRCGTTPPFVSNCLDVYLHDRSLGTYELVSVSGDGTPGNDLSGGYDDLAVSADGRYVAFSSFATNLAPSAMPGVFVRDRVAGTTVHLAAAYPLGVRMSGDGRFVAFDGKVSQNRAGVSIHDRDQDNDGIYDEPGAVQTTVVSDPARNAYWPDLSDDGRFVAFYVRADIGVDTVLLDRDSGQETVVGHTKSPGVNLAVSGDGGFVAFASEEPLSPALDDNAFNDVYLYDRGDDALHLLSAAPDGTAGDGPSAWGFKMEHLTNVALSSDGRFVAFESSATDLAPPGLGGVFVAGTPRLLGDLDTDRDGCADKRELGPDERRGGRRNPDNFWDFFDAPLGSPPARDRAVSVGDIGGVVARFGASGDPSADPLSPPPPAPAYHPAYDRGGSISGQDPWDLLPADGSISVGDVGAAVAQFGHSCV